MAEEMHAGSGDNGNLHARIAERAYEFYHRRGDHDEEDLRDWLAAEQEILKGAAK